ncbi:MAG: glycosyltransferase family 4 protein [Candidatus Rifleibacteriota bacterium]
MSSAGTPERILIISQFYYPDITACAFRIKETADWLAQQGCEVHIIAGEPHKGQLGQQLPDNPLIRVTRVPLFKFDGKGRWNYIRHYLSFMLGAIAQAGLHPGNFDVIWASSPPLFTGIAGFVVAKLKKARFCLDIRDIWPESAVVAGQISGNGILFNSAKVVEKLLYRLADQITCVAQPMADYIQKISKRRRPEVIYNAIPAEMLGEEPAKPDAAPEQLNILYIGNMGFCQNLSLVIEAADLLKKQNHHGIRFKLVGNGVEKKLLEEEIARRALDNVEIHGIVPKDEAINLIKTSDALMLHLKDDGTMDKTIPSKVFDYLAGGRPILFGLKGEAAKILAESGGNLYYDPASPEWLARRAVELQQNYLVFARKATINREMVKQRFLREKMAEKLLSIFREFCRV